MARKKFVIEYDFEKVPLSLLWQFLYTNSGLETWYADEVTNDGKNYTIVWDDEPHDALLLGKIHMCVSTGRMMPTSPHSSRCVFWFRN